jgi:acetyl-CoA carboxylase beta subunit
MNKIESFDDFDQIPIQCDNCGELFSTDLLSDDTYCPRCKHYIEIDESLVNNFHFFYDDYDVLSDIERE